MYQSIKFNFANSDIIEYHKNKYYGKKEIGVAKQPKTVSSDSGIDVVFIMLESAGLRSNFYKLINSLAHGRFDDFSQNFYQFMQYNPRIDAKLFVRNQFDVFTFKISDLNELSDLVDEANKALSKFDAGGEANSADKRLEGLHLDQSNTPKITALAQFNEKLELFSSFITKMAFGINELTGIIASSNQISQAYCESVSRKEDLAKFCSLCIQNHVPPKFIANKLYLLANKELRGDAKEDRPRFGQSRFTLRPKKSDHVLKFALNSLGIRGNKTERNISESLIKNGRPPVITYVDRSYENYTMNEVEKANSFGAMLKKEDFCNELQKTLNDELAHAGLNHQVSDVWQANIGTVKGKWVVLDYGG